MPVTSASAAAASSPVSGSAQASELASQPLRLLGRQRGGDAQTLGVGLLALAEADDEDAARAVGVERRELLEARPWRRRRPARRRSPRGSDSSS